MTSTTKLDMGCTKARHAQLGIDCVVNARAGLQHLNDVTLDDIEFLRDAQKIKDRLEKRIRFYRFHSKYFRRHQARFAHLISNYAD